MADSGASGVILRCLQMALYEIEITLSVLVDQDEDNADAARRVATREVARGPCVFVKEGIEKSAGHYLVKGLSAEVASCRLFTGNGRVMKKQKEGEHEEDTD